MTPRFVPSCTDEGLAGLGQLAQKYDVHVQSHCSEGQWEHDHVLERFGKTDTEVLRDFGLLGEKAVMAHCNFIDEKMVRSLWKQGLLLLTARFPMRTLPMV